ncbi:MULTISPECIES: hypothetical protein [Paenibacillus]|uniref:hypothetical protein n=1 Tax=Paenibacillus TaxID=44249 RepID=UPI000A08EEA7|nr:MULTISPECIES: hypothetical protein [Paenibacillus]MDU0330131.1 hypothetical protein [Paenibacillus sp. 3LSP]SME91905.1 hypothetical protein SAMN02744102_00314 [Paenibacillus barengoltzii]
MKSLVWLLFSVSSFLAATIYMLDIGTNQNAFYDALAVQLHGVRRSVYAHEGKVLTSEEEERPLYEDPQGETIGGYTGNDLLHRIPDWIELGVEIEVDGEVLNNVSLGPMEDMLEVSRKRALQVLNLRAKYSVENRYDSSGKVTRAIIHRK